MISVARENKRLVRPARGGGFDHHRRLVPLTGLDLFTPSIHVEVIYAFQPPTPPTSVLEEGLAKVLTEFREWAGRFSRDNNGRLAIELNDQGVALMEARADSSLADAMPFNPSPFLQQLIPPTQGVSELLLIQLTRFTCGGLVIGIARHHRVADGEAATYFMNSWGKTVRGEAVHPLPIHDRSVLMPRDPPTPMFDHIEYSIAAPKPVSSNNCATKRFHFSADFLRRLRTVAGKPFTRFESLYAHLWRCISKARDLHWEVVTGAKLAVNGRKRLEPSLPSEYLGNVVCSAYTQSTVKEVVEESLGFAANLIHNAITRIDDKYIRSAIDLLETRPLNPRRIDPSSSPNVRATSWLSFPMYELDFGWGKPVFVGLGSLEAAEGALVFIPAQTKDGSIDVVVHLYDSHMAAFEQICHTI
eukprot:Gb_38698 [translate_table: standard]